MTPPSHPNNFVQVKIMEEHSSRGQDMMYKAVPSDQYCDSRFGMLDVLLAVRQCAVEQDHVLIRR